MPLAEHDVLFADFDLHAMVSIHVPLAEHDQDVLKIGFAEFQFTCPSRSTTQPRCAGDTA